MSGGDRQTRLANDIAAIVRRRTSGRSGSTSSLRGRCLLMTGVALAVMQTQNAGALTLGELTVRSAIGQPLVASTTARIGPGESLSSACISVPRGDDGGFTNPQGLTVTAQTGNTPGNYPVQIRSAKPLYEPMYEIRLLVDCPGGVALAKSYVVMLNLPMLGNTAEQATAGQRQTLVAPADTPARAPEPRTETRVGRPAAAPTLAGDGRRSSANTNSLAASRGPIAAGERYRVRNGDTLSTIAERVEGRPVGSTWKVADMLFERNPQAFVRGNRDMLKLGAVLEIPDTVTLAGEVPAKPSRLASIEPQRPASSGSAANGTELSRREEFVPDPSENLSDAAISNEALLADIRAANAAAQSLTVPAGDVSPFADEAIASEPDANVVTAESDKAEAASIAALTERASGKPATDIAVSEQPPTTAATSGTDRTTANMSPFIAVAAGIGLGALLALLFLGRNLLGTLREARARRAAALGVAPTAALGAERELQPVRPAYGGAGIQVEVGTAPAPAEMPTEAPRVSLRAPEQDEPVTDFDNMLEELEHTAQLEVPALNLPLDAAGSDDDPLSDSKTMRNLFETAIGAPSADDTESADDETAEITAEMSTDLGPTAEMPAFETAAVGDDDSLDIDLTDLESLSRRLEDTADDELSRTLTQALGLLEKDYEDELTASQVLERREVEEALGRQRRDD